MNHLNIVWFTHSNYCSGQRLRQDTYLRENVNGKIVAIEDDEDKVENNERKVVAFDKKHCFS